MAATPSSSLGSGPPRLVALDATPLLDRPTGVGAFARAVLEGLADRPQVAPVAFALTWRGRHRLAAVVPPGTRVVDRPAPARPLRAAWSRCDRPVIERWTGPVDVVHGTNFVVPPAARAAQVVTVHDLTCLHHPELCTPDTLAYPALVRRAVQRGAFVHAVSGFVADEVVAELGVPEDRVVAVPNGSAPPAAGDGAVGRRLVGAGPDDRYVLALGTVEPRKDLPSLVRAFEQLAAARPDLRLVVAGPDGWGADALTEAVFRTGDQARARIRRLGWVSDRERADLLAGAAVVAYPSVYEGFGLVPLEAMAVGVPVVATAAGAVPEVVGDAASLVPVGDVDGLAGALAAVLDDPSTAAGLRARGHRRARRFTWSATVDGLIGLYEQALAARR